MCCNKRRQQRLQQQVILQNNHPLGYRTGGCCGARRQRRLLELENANQPVYQAPEVTEARAQGISWSEVRDYRSPMAGIVAVGIAIGAEKLSRKISEKKLERKDRKAAEQREAIYGPGESSSANSAAQTKMSRHISKQERKSEEARREQEQTERRRSVSSERTLLPEQPPPRYEDVVRGDATRAPSYS
ncbi:hypothetical protein DE146DRAFT_758164 [Phaeosphaeria sp. MPI-PUGE-AT-0046c]|nr:hypothetical protein DE146DRAFT_758164 [Phaeosphaeria sp. MPI-PUGE-AT-0046c]